MSSKSNDHGRAFEYVFINTLYEKLCRCCSRVEMFRDGHYAAAQNAYNNTEEPINACLHKSAEAAADAVMRLEPNLFAETDDKITLSVQPDSNGMTGDVRDIVVRRDNIEWEIGFSLKHNHFAVKHSRLSQVLDFGEKWYGTKCSTAYWMEIRPIFDYIKTHIGSKWRDLPDKNDNIYVPLLKAFVEEIKRANMEDKDMPKKMVEYLLGKYDFYKVISIDNRNMAQIESFNLHGTLNKPSRNIKPELSIPVANLPSRLIHIGLVPGFKNKAEMLFDEGWSFSFRIHNASTMVEPSLKFDIQFVGVPANIVSINCKWHQA